MFTEGLLGFEAATGFWMDSDELRGRPSISVRALSIRRGLYSSVVNNNPVLIRGVVQRMNYKVRRSLAHVIES